MNHLASAMPVVGFQSGEMPLRIRQLLNLNEKALPAPTAGTLAQMGNANSVPARFQLNSFQEVTTYSGVRYNITAGNYSALVSGNVVTQITMKGYDGTVESGAQATMRAVANENWVHGSNLGSRWEWLVTPNGSTASASAMTLDSTGLTLPSLTAGRVTFAGVGGRLVDDGDFTFAVDTLTVTKMAGTTFTSDVIMGAGVNLLLNSGSGTQIGSAPGQKLGLWGAGAVIQQTTASAAATFVAHTSGIVDDSATFDGYSLGQVVKILRTIGVLA